MSACFWFQSWLEVLSSSRTTLNRGVTDVPFVQKENGPFMVMAKVLRGADAEKYAKDLATELRQEHELPAYLFRVKPRDAAGVEEVAVFVGDAKTLEESKAILEQVKAISPRCLADMPNLRQRSLAHAIRIPNPLIPAQVLVK